MRELAILKKFYMGVGLILSVFIPPIVGGVINYLISGSPFIGVFIGMFITAAGLSYLAVEGYE